MKILKDKVLRKSLMSDLNLRVKACRVLRGIPYDGIKPSMEVANVAFEIRARPKSDGICKIVNRCVVTGRSRAVFRKHRVNRIRLRDDALRGALPGMSKKTW
jgi:small subunit ribosomal protein S14